MIAQCARISKCSWVASHIAAVITVHNLVEHSALPSRLCSIDIYWLDFSNTEISQWQPNHIFEHGAEFISSWVALIFRILGRKVWLTKKHCLCDGHSKILESHPSLQNHIQGDGWWAGVSFSPLGVLLKVTFWGQVILGRPHTTWNTDVFRFPMMFMDTSLWTFSPTSHQ